jgi:hypothetical protein
VVVVVVVVMMMMMMTVTMILRGISTFAVLDENIHGFLHFHGNCGENW